MIPNIVFRSNRLNMLLNLKLQRFVVDLVIPSIFLVKDDHLSITVNPACEKWEVQDQILLSWLQSTLSKTILSRVLGPVHSYQV